MRDWQRDWDMCQKATAGKWKWRERAIQDGLQAISMPIDLMANDNVTVLYPSAIMDTRTGIYVAYIDMRDEDAEFIAEAREALPYWLERVQELEEENNRLQKIANMAHGYIEMVRNFLDGLQCDRNMKDSLDYFYKGAKAVERAGVELEKMLQESEVEQDG